MEKRVQAAASSGRCQQHRLRYTTPNRLTERLHPLRVKPTRGGSYRMEAEPVGKLLALLSTVYGVIG
ncbi:MAG: hypothetical protein RhofKO_20970 [Rhodothermales bacterium]